MKGFELTFKVKKIYWRSNDYAYIQVHKFECKNKIIKKQLGKTMLLKGHFNIIMEGDTFTSTVEIREDKKDGKKFLYMIGFPQTFIPENEEALALFINRRIRGLSLSKSKLIVNQLGISCIKKIIEDPTLLDDPALKLNKATKERIMEQFKYCQNYDEVGMYIQSMGLPLNIANVLYDKYQDDTLKLLKDNPYQICYDGEIPFKIADRIALENNLQHNSKLRIQTGLLAYLNSKSENDGYTCVHKDEKEYKSKKNFYQQFNQFLKKNGSIKGELINDEIDEGITNLINDKKMIEEIDTKGKKYLYLPILYVMENSIASNLRRINNRFSMFCEEKDVDEFFDEYTGYPLDPKQKDFIYKAMRSNLAILTGGPGTGKTATVNVLVQAIKEISLKVHKRKAEICLLAPTGKAADRMTELTGEPASTIHRKLGIIGEFQCISTELDYDYVIIDESSMIDIYIMDLLVKANANNTRYIFVGDINQLPSVGPGKILDDMIDSGVISTTTLTTVFRQAQGSVIVENSHHIINEEDTNNGFKLNEGNSHFVEEQDSVEIKNRIVKVIEDLQNQGYKHHEIAILSPMREKDAGTYELNELFQEYFNHSTVEYKFGDKKFKLGDRVIQTKNNYDLSVYNGFVGTIIDIYQDDGDTYINVDFDANDSIVTYDEFSIFELELAYSITTHKSQGSEYPVVIMPVHLAQSQMLTTKLLYTGITRAKKELYLVGQEEAINRCIHEKSKNKHDYRISRLAEKIGK